jgi:purine catabolism regulator
VVVLDALYRIRAAEPEVPGQHAQDLHLADWGELRGPLRDAARTRAQQAARAGDRHLLVSPVVGGGEGLGFVVHAGERPPALVERSTLESAALIAATEFLRERAREEGEIRRRAEILDQLLSGQVPGPGHPLHGLQPPLVVAVGELVSAEDGAGPRRFRALLATVQQEVEQLQPPATVTVKGRHAVVLWGPVDGTGPRRLAAALDAAGRALQRVGADADAHFAVSELAESLADLAGVYEEGRLALEIRREAGRTERVTLVGDLGAYRLIARAANGPEALDLVRRVLGPIEEHDRERGRGLLTTLQSYLAEGGSVRAAASRLGVHPHTVQYRLERVQDLCGLRLSRTEDRMTLDLALRIRGVATRVVDS